jgi:hypothetical protein
MTSDYVIGANQLLSQQPGNHRFGHRAATDEREAAVFERADRVANHQR